jgi:tellurite resistance protein
MICSPGTMSQQRTVDLLRGDLSLSVTGLRFFFRTTGHGTLHCQRCGGDRGYQRCIGRRWIHVLNIPVIPLDRIGEHVQCRTCLTRYRLELLIVPTTAEMQVALPAAALAAVTIMLKAGDPASAPARGRAIEIVRAAGLAGYDDAALAADLVAAGDPDLDVPAPLAAVAKQLLKPATEWFLADAVRVGLADGPLSDDERDAARAIAAHLGMTSAQAHGVISLTEQSAAAG